MHAVDVVIPVRNRAGLALEAIRSVQKQSHADLTIWVVDDGSDDGTPEEIEAACASDARVRVVRHGESRGPAHARHTGFASGQADLVAILDSDDLWLPRKIEKQVLRLAQTGAEVALCWWEWVRPDGHVRITRRPEGEGMVSPLLCDNMDVPLMRRASLDRIGGFVPSDLPGTGAHHIEFGIRLLARSTTTVVPEVLVRCRDHSAKRMSDGITTRRGATELDDVVRGRQVDLQPWPVELASLRCRAAGRYFSAGDARTGLRLLSEAIARAPYSAKPSLLRQWGPLSAKRTLALLAKRPSTPEGRA